MENRNILTSGQTTGDPFEATFPFKVYFVVYSDGWYVEFTDKDTPEASRVWFRYNERPLQNSPGKSHVIVPGSKDLLYRMNGGTAGAVIKRTNVKLLTS